MKKIIITSLLTVMICKTQAQVAIGKPSSNNTSVILEFDDASTNKKGIILPAVENINNALIASDKSSNNGTFLFDRSDDKVKMFENNVWVELSDPGSESKIEVNNSPDQGADQGVVIGSATSPAKGVLILESTNKAMVLPWIQNPHITVKNPYPGMICFDTTSRSVAIFDGLVWNFWK